MLNYEPDVPKKSTKLPIGQEQEMMPQRFQSNLDRGFTNQEIQRLKNYDLSPPTQILKESIGKKENDNDDYDKQIGEILKELGREKGPLSKSEKRKKHR